MHTEKMQEVKRSINICLDLENAEGIALSFWYVQRRLKEKNNS